MWVALEDGLASMRLGDDGKWIDEGRVPGIRETIGYLAEPAVNELWLGTGAQGAIRVRFERRAASVHGSSGSVRHKG